ncbi:MAG: hypothetical protein BGN82_10840 [Alphaproteobacteria bacterium 65-7]|nr:MAG: hypothetical protein BGN82_10840 [Alphaproteobacteria bacterium 65-7]
MQVSATLIAAQQAAREARSRLNMPQGQPAYQPQQAAATAKASFASALENTSGVSQGFSPLPLKQTAAAPAPAAAQPGRAPARMGQHVNILV